MQADDTIPNTVEHALDLMIAPLPQRDSAAAGIFNNKLCWQCGDVLRVEVEACGKSSNGSRINVLRSVDSIYLLHLRILSHHLFGPTTIVGK
jgi:hypothetical protein